jgi:hypothetical protein
MKTPIKPLLLSIAAFVGLALNASAQGMSATAEPTAFVPSSGYGLLGQDYAGFVFGYTQFDDGEPSSARTYGFIANRPTEVANLDASFKYEYSRMNAFGLRGTSHDVSVGATAYRQLSNFKPFVQGNVGWAFAKTGGFKDDSFFYVATAGAEFQVMTRLAVAPYVSYSEAPHFHSRGFDFGVKAAYRFNQQWGGIVAVQFDDDYIDYRIGVNRHF